MSTKSSSDKLYQSWKPLWILCAEKALDDDSGVFCLPFSKHNGELAVRADRPERHRYFCNPYTGPGDGRSRRRTVAMNSGGSIGLGIKCADPFSIVFAASWER